MPTAEELISVASITELARILSSAQHSPDNWRTVKNSIKDLPALGLSERARIVGDAILHDLPGGYPALAPAIRAALKEPNFSGWMIWPVTEAVASAATTSPTDTDFDDGLQLLAELTPRLTSEFAIRTFLNADLARTLDTVLTWTDHTDPAVRRLASEGTRPKLPWARQVPKLNSELAVTVPILDRLYQDPADFVRRSVSNHLNDISRLSPGVAIAAARRWAAEPATTTPAVIRHSMRTLIKKGDPDALALLGFHGDNTALTVTGPTISAPTFTIGQELLFTARIINSSSAPVTLAIDYVIHYLKANGRPSPHVFKLAKRTLQPGESCPITRRHSFRLITTRTYYPGLHTLELQINGHRHGQSTFTLQPSAIEPTGLKP
jgi:3-methyladenine DNA glycosylase AlkC